MKVKKLGLCLLLASISLYPAGCGETERQKIEVSEPVIIGTALWDHYALFLCLEEGQYESVCEIGPDFGANWVGQYELRLLDVETDTILSSYRLTEWEEPLRFHKNIDLRLTDLNSDGCREVLIGQYAASNYNLYRMYYVDNEMQIGYYSDIGVMEISSQDMSPQLEVSDGKITYSLYDNAQGSMVKKEMDLKVLDIIGEETDFDNG